MIILDNKKDVDDDGSKNVVLKGGGVRMMMMCGGVCYIAGDKIFSRFTDFWSEIDRERKRVINYQFICI